MEYKNVSNKSRYIVCGSVRRLIPAGGIVGLSTTDIRHSGGAVRFFESVYKSQEIADDMLRRSFDSRPTAAYKPPKKVVVESAVAESVIEELVEENDEVAVEPTNAPEDDEEPKTFERSFASRDTLVEEGY